jgi:hypothetical protein
MNNTGNQKQIERLKTLICQISNRLSADYEHSKTITLESGLKILESTVCASMLQNVFTEYFTDVKTQMQQYESELISTKICDYERLQKLVQFDTDPYLAQEMKHVQNFVRLTTLVQS